MTLKLEYPPNADHLVVLEITAKNPPTKWPTGWYRSVARNGDDETYDMMYVDDPTKEQHRIVYYHGHPTISGSGMNFDGMSLHHRLWHKIPNGTKITIGDIIVDD